MSRGGNIARTPLQRSYIDLLGRRVRRLSRDTIFAMVADHRGRFGVGRQNTPEGEWGPVQGKIEPVDKNAKAAALRELDEEIGLREESFDIIHPQIYREKLMGSRDPAYTHGLYIGHLVRLMPGTRVRLSPEIREWRFGTVSDIQRLLIEQPDVVRGADLERLERIREKARKIFCPALDVAARILDDYALLSKV